MKITEFEINLQKENVLRLIDCHSDSPVYESVSKEYEEIISQAYERLNPIAILECGSFRKKEIVFFVSKRSDKISAIL